MRNIIQRFITQNFNNAEKYENILWLYADNNR